jgi:hypothetical protein
MIVIKLFQGSPEKVKKVKELLCPIQRIYISLLGLIDYSFRSVPPSTQEGITPFIFLPLSHTHSKTIIDSSVSL